MAIFDAHAYLTDSKIFHGMADVNTATRTLSQYGIDGVALISGLAAHCDFIVGNEQLSYVLNPNSNIFGYVTLNAGYPVESMEEQRKYMFKPEFVAGLLFGHDGMPVTLADARDIINAQRRYAKPLAIHVPDAEAVAAAREIAAEFPAMKLILLTMGGDDWHSAVAAAKQYINIYLEISGSTDSDKIDEAAATITPRKLVYGSGLPYNDPNLTIGLVEDAKTLTTMDKGRVYYQNAISLFNAQQD